jgi:beta-N-acetylhexosaminidase
VASDGVAEEGLPAGAVKQLFSAYADVEFVLVHDLREIAAHHLPQDGRYNVLVSNHRLRYPAQAAAARPDLHLVLWNPLQVLDIAAPAVVTWGYADGAIDALHAWLEGRATAPGHAPVPLTPKGER